jgi:hypothetical protein
MTALLVLLAIAGYQNRDNARRLGKRGAAGEGVVGGLLGQLRKNLARPVPVGGPHKSIHPLSLKRRSDPRCWTPCRNQRVYQKTICLVDCLVRFQTPSTSEGRLPADSSKRFFARANEGTPMLSALEGVYLLTLMEIVGPLHLCIALAKRPDGPRVGWNKTVFARRASIFAKTDSN